MVTLTINQLTLLLKILEGTLQDVPDPMLHLDAWMDRFRKDFEDTFLFHPTLDVMLKDPYLVAFINTAMEYLTRETFKLPQ